MPRAASAYTERSERPVFTAVLGSEAVSGGFATLRTLPECWLAPFFRLRVQFLIEPLTLCNVERALSRRAFDSVNLFGRRRPFRWS